MKNIIVDGHEAEDIEAIATFSTLRVSQTRMMS